MTNASMAEACYTARATTKQQVLNGIEKLMLHKNEHGQYTHNTTLLFEKGIKRVLISQCLTQTIWVTAQQNSLTMGIISSRW